VQERAHFWLPNSESASPTTHELLDSPTSERMYIDQNEIVRVRVEMDEFWDDEPGPPKAQEGVHVRRELRRAPFSIIVRSFSSEGELGLILCLHSAQLLNKALGLWHGGNRRKQKRWTKSKLEFLCTCIIGTHGSILAATISSYRLSD
jgi:hypothetical protein